MEPDCDGAPGLTDIKHPLLPHHKRHHPATVLCGQCNKQVGSGCILLDPNLLDKMQEHIDREINLIRSLILMAPRVKYQGRRIIGVTVSLGTIF